MPRAAGRRKVPPPVANGLGERVGLRWLLSRGKTVGEGFMSSDIATGIPESAARPRRSAVVRRSRRALAVLLLGPLTILAGLVWAVPDAAWRGDISALLAPLAAELDALGLAAHVPYAPRRYDVAANWKLVNDASLDSYHIRHAHRKTIAPLFFDTMCVFDRFGANQRIFLAKRSIETLRNTDPAGWRIRDHGSPLYFFFPGTVVLLEPDHAQIAQIWPAAPDRTAHLPRIVHRR